MAAAIARTNTTHRSEAAMFSHTVLVCLWLISWLVMSRTWRVPLVPAANLTADHPPARAVCCLSPRCERAWSPSFRRFVAGRAPHLPPPRLESSRNTHSGALAPAGQQLVPALGTHTQREREPGHAPASLLAQRCRDLATAIELGSALWAGRIKLCLEERTGSSPPIPP